MRCHLCASHVVLTSDTHSVGRFATFTIGIFGNMIEIIMFTRWHGIGLGATRGTSGSAPCVEFPPSDSIAVGASIEASVKGCNLSGKESPPAFAGVDRLGHAWFSDLNGCFPVFQECSRMRLRL